MGQLFLFLPCVIFGLAMGLLFVVMNFIKTKTNCPPIPYILDVLYVLVAFCGFIIITLLLCNGKFYFYMLAGFSVGIILFNMLLTLLPLKKYNNNA